MLLSLTVGLILVSSVTANAAQVKPDWYLPHEVINQQSTAYLSKPGDRTAGLTDYYIGIVAVHPKTPGGSGRDPIIAFGTYIWLETPNVTIQGTSYNHFEVMDTGDLNYQNHSGSANWIDIYFGQWNGPGDTSNPNYIAAKNYGNANLVDYNWEEWLN